MTLPGHASLAATGAGAAAKRGQVDDLYIVPLGDEARRARETDRAVRVARGTAPTASDAIIVADRTTPFRLLLEVLFTLGQHEFGRFHLMVVQGHRR